MTRLTRLYIKTSLVFLVAGLLVGAYIIVMEFVLGVFPSRLLITAHVHLLLVGFMLMMVMGVATWMFPRPASDDRRYHPALAVAAYWLVTLATVVRASAEIGAAFFSAPGLRPVIAIGGLGQIVAAAMFALNIWPRVRIPAGARDRA
jgi:cbb3-type cytochrome oxidase subunit 1